MKKNALIHTRIEPCLKAEAEAILAEIGLSSSEAIRLFYQQIRLNKGLPFRVIIPAQNHDNIRLPRYVIDVLIQSFSKIFLKNDELILFGSRANPNKKGGDIDLCVHTALDNYNEAEDRKIQFLCDVKRQIGEQKIDIVLRLKNSPINEHIDEIIAKEGIRIL